MGRMLLAVGLAMMICTVATAQTIVRHERTVHGEHSSVSESSGEDGAGVLSPAAETSLADNEVITVYGPYGGADGETSILQEGQENERQQLGQAQIKLSDEEAARARLEKFIGQEHWDRNFWLKEGVEENLPYRDCIYLQGGTKGQEEYIIALRRQGNPEPSAPDLYSLVLLVGRGQLGKLAFDTEKMPGIELVQGGLSKAMTFTESRVRLPVAFMLRIEPKQVREIAAADGCQLLFSTGAGDCRVELPVEMRKEWLKVLE